MARAFCRFACRMVIAVGAALEPVSRAEDSSGKSKKPARSRKFEFTYATTVTGLPPGKVARIWLPVPPTNDEQQVKMIAKDLPEKHKISREPKHGNDILYVEARAGEDGTVSLSVTYRVLRREVKADLKEHDDTAAEFARFLAPDAKVPVGGKPLELVKDKKIPEDQLAM